MVITDEELKNISRKFQIAAIRKREYHALARLLVLVKFSSLKTALENIEKHAKEGREFDSIDFVSNVNAESIEQIEIKLMVKLTE